MDTGGTKPSDGGGMDVKVPGGAPFCVCLCIYLLLEY